MLHETDEYDKSRTNFQNWWLLLPLHACRQLQSTDYLKVDFILASMDFYSDSSQDEADHNNRGFDDDSFPRKRRKRTKEDQMLGIFGSDSEGDRSSRLDRKTFHDRAVKFHKADHHLSSEDEGEPELFTLSQKVGQNPTGSLSSTAIRAVDAHKSTNERFISMTEPLKRRVPTFGMYQDSSPAFIPSYNPPPAARTPAMVDLSMKMQYLPQESRKLARPGTEDASAAKLLSGKAARMMAKMGYRSGEGLGTSGTGIVKPIEAKLRPGQTAGLGSVNEQDDPLKGLDRPRHDHERKQPKARHEAPRKPKTKYKTAKEIASEAGGNMKIPSTLQSILDLTGGQPKVITDSTKFVSSSGADEANTNLRISLAAHREVEQLANEWRTLQDRKAYLAAEQRRGASDLLDATTKVSNIEELIVRVKRIQSSTLEMYDEVTKITRLTEQLEMLQNEVLPVLESPRLDQIVTAVITPHFRQAMASWDVMAEPSRFKNEFLRLAKALRLHEIKSQAIEQDNKRRSLAFESFMSLIWFPRIRTAIGTSWDPTNSTAVLDLLNLWLNLLPKFLLDQMLDQLIIPRLAVGLNTWSPRRSRQQKSLSWLFLWLPILGDKVGELTEMMKRRFNVVLAQWKLKDGVVPEVEEWREVLGTQEIDEILARHVLPKLASAMRTDLTIDPANQDLGIVETVLAWRYSFRLAVMGQLFKVSFFPKWLNLLYLWLTGSPNFEEISEWYEWWQSVFPADLRAEAGILKGFAKGIEMMNTTLELGAAALLPPRVGPELPMDHQDKIKEKSSTSRQAQVDVTDAVEINFKDVVENWCAENDLLLLPLRKSHESGNSLFRITSSAVGGRGITVYLRGDIVMMEDKGRFLATSLGDVGLALA